jgi:glucose-1-phosphate cytidylyltransferase
MKAVILAGGLGTRISEETVSRPKPMVEIGGMPILWHIMKIYSAHGINDFIICGGYKCEVIKNYFANYMLYRSDIVFDMVNDTTEVLRAKTEPWRVTVADTGEDSMTGGRLMRVADLLKDEEAFCFTYGDGVGDVNITELVEFHRRHGKLATVTAVKPPGRLGVLDFDSDNLIKRFEEKPNASSGAINGGFFVLNPKVFGLIDGDTMIWEKEPMGSLSRNEELMAFEHEGFWQPMDTLRDRNLLQELWQSGNAPWKIW